LANGPLIGEQDRPDLTVEVERKVGDLTVRELATILGVDLEIELQEGGGKTKDQKDRKDRKDRKDGKDNKDQKDQKDPKDQKDQKDNKDQKDPKDQKDSKDQKDEKDTKDIRDGIRTPKQDKDQKDHKESKEFIDGTRTPKPDKDQKDQKDLTDVKQGEPKGADAGQRSVQDLGDLDQLIKRVSGLEQAVEELKGLKK
jgi:hypothetical protein